MFNVLIINNIYYYVNELFKILNKQKHVKQICTPGMVNKICAWYVCTTPRTLKVNLTVF